MKVHITVDDSQADAVTDDLRSAAVAAAQATLEQESARPGELTILLTGDEMLAALNQSHRGMLGPTDVLAFPAGEMPTIPDLQRYYGDIAISVPRAQAQATTRGHDLRDEIQLLVVHGVLHLLGHDHSSPEEKNAMWSVQAKILAQIGVSDQIAG